MAKMSFSPLVTQIVGKLGQTVVLTGRYGPVVRLSITANGRPTPKQMTARAALSAAAKSWGLLTPTNRTNWSTFAATISRTSQPSGTVYTPLGFNVFCELASFYLIAHPGGSPPTSPPAGAFAGDTITVTAAASTGTITFTGSAGNGTGIQTVMLYQFLLTPTRKPGSGSYRIGKIAQLQSPLFQSSLTGLTPGVYACAYKFVLMATGQTTLPVTIGTVVVV